MGRKYRPATRPRGGGIITRGLDPREPGDNDDRDGYSDLEEYLNWLARSRVRDQMCGPLRDEQPLGRLDRAWLVPQVAASASAPTD